MFRVSNTSTRLNVGSGNVWYYRDSFCLVEFWHIHPRLDGYLFSLWRNIFANVRVWYTCGQWRSIHKMLEALLKQLWWCCLNGFFCNQRFIQDPFTATIGGFSKVTNFFRDTLIAPEPIEDFPLIPPETGPVQEVVDVGGLAMNPLEGTEFELITTVIYLLLWIWTFYIFESVYL